MELNTYMMYRKLTNADKRILRPIREEERHMANLPAYPGMPRWVKVSGAAAGVLLLLVVLVAVSGFGGPHGPGRHIAGNDDGDPTPSVAGEPASGGR